MYHPRLQGKHYDMGFHYGALLKKNGVSFHEVIKLTTEQMEFGSASLEICEKSIPNICSEIKGLSDGLDYSYQNFAAWLLTMYGFGDVHGCTCFCMKANEKIIFGRNSDMFPDLKPTSESVLYRPDSGYMFLGHSTAMITIEDGINEYGLAAGMNFLATKSKRPGLNSGFLIRHILECCKTVDEGISVLQSLPISSTQNIIMADKLGNMAVVECSPDMLIIRRPEGNNDFLVSSNHFIDEKMQNEHANPEANWYHSYDRYDAVFNALSQKQDEISANDAMAVLGGKYGYTCQYGKELNFETIWSVVYDLTEMKIYRAEGNPSKTKFKEDTRLSWGISKK